MPLLIKLGQLQMYFAFVSPICLSRSSVVSETFLLWIPQHSNPICCLKTFFHMLKVNNNVVDSTLGVLLFIQQTCYNIVQEYWAMIYCCSVEDLNISLDCYYLHHKKSRKRQTDKLHTNLVAWFIAACTTLNGFWSLLLYNIRI